MYPLHDAGYGNISWVGMFAPALGSLDRIVRKGGVCLSPKGRRHGLHENAVPSVTTFVAWTRGCALVHKSAIGHLQLATDCVLWRGIERRVTVFQKRQDLKFTPILHETIVAFIVLKLQHTTTAAPQARASKTRLLTMPSSRCFSSVVASTTYAIQRHAVNTHKCGYLARRISGLG